MSSAQIWIGILACAGGTYAFKLLGLSVPESVLERPFVQRLSLLLPVALLSALVAVGTFGLGKGLAADARIAGVAAAVIALLLRAPFLLVVVIAAAVAAGLRALGG
jgi:branched-subunit amino acid transport protein